MGSNAMPSQERLAEFEAALERNDNNASAASREIGIPASTGRDWRQNFINVDPGIRRAAETVGLADVSKLKHGWIKSKDEDGNSVSGFFRNDVTDDTLSRIKDKFADLKPRLGAIPKPSQTDASTLALYPLADLHIGLLAWGQEVEQDWDINIAVKAYRDCMERVATDTPNSSEAVILGGGDLLHSDGYKPMTPQSGNILDVDSRFPKALDAAIELLAFQIDLALAKHKKVTVRILPGNHDESAAIATTYALSAWYRNDKRVTVDKDPSLFWWYRFGKTFLGATHGHAAKLKDMPLIMANRMPEDWAAGEYRYVHGFHVHHKEQFAWEHGGVIGEVHQSPAVQDAYHWGKGYLSGRSMQSITYHKEYGEWGRTPRAMK